MTLQHKTYSCIIVDRFGWIAVEPLASATRPVFDRNSGRTARENDFLRLPSSRNSSVSTPTRCKQLTKGRLHRTRAAVSQLAHLHSRRFQNASTLTSGVASRTLAGDRNRQAGGSLSSDVLDAVNELLDQWFPPPQLMPKEM